MEILDEVAEVSVDMLYDMLAKLPPLPKVFWITLDRHHPWRVEILKAMHNEKTHPGIAPVAPKAPQTKSCGSCEAPVDVNGPSHASAGDCRSAQRKEIRKLRSENENLRGRLSESEKMMGIDNITLEVPINRAGDVLRSGPMHATPRPGTLKRVPRCTCLNGDFDCRQHPQP